MNTNDRAIEMVKELRQQGLDVARVVVEGRKIEITFKNQDEPQKIDNVQW